MTSTSDGSNFNGPFKRAELLLLPQYTASNNFLAAGKWTGTKPHVLSLNNDDGAQTTEPLYCIVVGTINADKTYLGKHGNFTPKYNDAALKAKLQFTLARPDDPDFGPDYDKAFLALEKLQNDVSTTVLQQYFLFKNEGDTMRMNYSLFDPKGDKNDKDREKETLIYCVDREYEQYWTTAKVGNYSCIMPAYDTDDTPIAPGHFAAKLVGATCEVTFTLKHFAIGRHKDRDGNWVEANDVFSAQVETVAILRKPPILASSPYKGRPKRRPHHKPQLPTRGEQISAARSFVPQLEYKPETATDLSTPPKVMLPVVAALPFNQKVDSGSGEPPYPTEAEVTRVDNLAALTSQLPMSNDTNGLQVAIDEGSRNKRNRRSSTSIATIPHHEVCQSEDDHPTKKQRLD